jgi:hypothetical protein
MRNPDLGQPADVWDEIPEALQVEIQDHVQESALGYPIVVGWENAAAVAGLTIRCLRRAVAKGRLPRHTLPQRGTRGCRVCWGLWELWRFRQWRETMHEVPRRGGP